MATRETVYAEMKKELGLVPGFFETMPEDSLEKEWDLFKRYVLLEKSEIPPKYRELIGLGAASAKQCWYCANFHTGVAKLHGATDAEIQEAVHLAKFGGGWSTYLNGIVYDQSRFMEELGAIGEYLSNKKK